MTTLCLSWTDGEPPHPLNLSTTSLMDQQRPPLLHSIVVQQRCIKYHLQPLIIIFLPLPLIYNIRWEARSRQLTGRRADLAGSSPISTLSPHPYDSPTTIFLLFKLNLDKPITFNEYIPSYLSSFDLDYTFPWGIHAGRGHYHTMRKSRNGNYVISWVGS